MSLQLSEFITEVRNNLGRLTDSRVITDTRITRWLNEAQRRIVRNIPGLVGRDVKDTTSLDLVSGTYSYSIASLTPKLAHVLNAYYYDSTSGSTETLRMDYLTLDEFDERFPRPEQWSQDKPFKWTRRGNTIEVFPIPSSSYADSPDVKVIRLDYTAYAPDLANSTDTSELSIMEDADDGLIYYATSKGWETIGVEEKYMIWNQKFFSWLEEYKEKSDAMLAWDGNILFDGKL